MQLFHSTKIIKLTRHVRFAVRYVQFASLFEQTTAHSVGPNRGDNVIIYLFELIQ